MHTKSAGVAKGFQDALAFGIGRRRQPVLPLIAEPSGFLSLRNVDRKLGVPLVDLHRRRPLAAQEALRQRQAFQRPAFRIVAQIDRLHSRLLHQEVAQ